MTNNKKMYSAALAGFGLILTAGSLAVFYVEQGFHLVAAGLLVAGAGLLVAGLVYKGRTAVAPSPWPRIARAGAGVALVSCVLLVFAGLNYFAARLPWRWDITRAKQHTLSPGTLAFLRGLPQEVSVTALLAGLPPAYLEDLFREYEKASNGRIKTEIIDPIEQIGYAAQFGNILDGKQHKIVVRSGKERRDVDFTDAPLSEEQVTNAVVRVTRLERQACFTAGHGEYGITDKGDQGLSRFAALLLGNNISGREILLQNEGKVPADCDVLVVAGPHNDLTQKEYGIIDDYLKQGGDALFLVENIVVTTPDRPLTDEEKHKNPSLNGILNSWGLNVEDDIVVDLSSHAGSDVGSPATKNYLPHKAIVQGLDYTFFVRPRSMNVMGNRRRTIKLAPVILTATKGKSWAETNRTLKVLFDEGVDTPGPVTLAYVGMEDKVSGEQSDTRFMVVTDADFLSNLYIDQYSNAALGLNVMTWLAETDYKVFLDSKEVKVETLNLTSKQKRKVAALLFLMPVLITAVGVMVWMRR